MTLFFKPIGLAHLDEVITVFQAAAEKIHKMQIDHWQYWRQPPEEKIDWVKKGLSQNEYFFIYNTAQQQIGMVRIIDKDFMYWGKQTEKAKYVHSLVVNEEFNGQGLGQLILEHIAEEAKAESCQYLRLDADSKNPKLCSYYAKLGFEQVGSVTLPLSTYTLFQKKLT